MARGGLQGMYGGSNRLSVYLIYAWETGWTDDRLGMLVDLLKADSPLVKFKAETLPLSRTPMFPLMV